MMKRETVMRAIELHENGMTWSDIYETLGVDKYVLMNRVYNTPGFKAKHRTVKKSTKPMFVRRDDDGMD